MILELVGSRVLAPYVGTSTIVWTTLIGMIMGFLSLGYWYGGRLADRLATLKIFSTIIFFSALSVFLIIFDSQFLLQIIRDNIINIYIGSILATLILFALPSFLLGLISPYAARLKMNSLESSGRTVGNLYALSTVGSIIGTFSAGFFLIPFLGTVKILYFIAILLVVSSLIVYQEKFTRVRWVFATLLILGLAFSFWQSAKANPNVFVDVDTPYNRVWVLPGAQQERRTVLTLKTDPFSTQSGMFLDKDDDLAFRYSRYYRLADFFNPNIKRALVVGGAAYSYPKDFLKKHSTANLDVVEIDSGMTKLAKKYFNLKDDERLKIYHQDGRVFLNQNEKKYDAIYMDAFTSHLSVPYQLMTREAVGKIYDSLSEDGVVMINIISAIDGEKGQILQAEYATYKEFFPQIYLFRVYNTDPARSQNLILVGLKKKWEGGLRADSAELKGYLDMEWRRAIPTDAPILTDDYAPVDYYAMKLI